MLRDANLSLIHFTLGAFGASTLWPKPPSYSASLLSYCFLRPKQICLVVSYAKSHRLSLWEMSLKSCRLWSLMSQNIGESIMSAMLCTWFVQSHYGFECWSSGSGRKTAVARSGYSHAVTGTVGNAYKC